MSDKESINQRQEMGTFRGAALLITLLVIGILSTVLFGASRLTIREIRSARAFADSTSAYFAAESGIEDGLLRFRSNRDIELTVGATASSQEGIRVNVTKNREVGQVALLRGDIVPSEAFYDLKIWYKTAQIGNFIACNPLDLSTVELLEKDAVRTLSGFSAITRLELKMQTDTPSSSSGLEVRLLSPTGAESIQFFPLPTSALSSSIPVLVGANEQLILRAFGGQIRFCAQPVSGNTLFDSGITHIESIGYYGGVKRKLEAKVERASGTVLGLFDYTLYSGSGSL